MKKLITDWNKYREQFVRETLRRASFRWPPRQMAIKAARTQRLINPETGKLCWHVICNLCRIEVLEKKARLDHIEPVVPIALSDMWERSNKPKSGLNLGTYVLRMFPEQSGFQVLCSNCHGDKTNEERELRAKSRKGRTRTKR